MRQNLPFVLLGVVTSLVACGGSSEPAADGAHEAATDATSDARDAAVGADALDAMDATSDALDAIEPTDALDVAHDVARDAPRDAGPGMLIQHIVAPRTTDAAIDTWVANHYAFVDTRVAPNGYLFVFLTGVGGTPAGALLPLHQAAGAGYHAIGLEYPNTFDIYGLCGTDPDCFGQLRTEALEGVDHTPVVTISRANSIESRLFKLLTYLDHTYPAEGWGAFITGALPAWSQVTIAGHSHGASASALIGRARLVHRVVILSGPYDHVPPNTPATWVRTPGLTPASAYFAFAHTHDAQYSQDVINWGALGMGASGALVDVDTHTTPFSGSHELSTSALPRTGSYNDSHSSTMEDSVTPLLPDGTPKFRPVWTLEFGP